MNLFIRNVWAAWFHEEFSNYWDLGLNIFQYCKTQAILIGTTNWWNQSVRLHQKVPREKRKQVIERTRKIETFLYIFSWIIKIPGTWKKLELEIFLYAIWFHDCRFNHWNRKIEKIRRIGSFFIRLLMDSQNSRVREETVAWNFPLFYFLSLSSIQ